MKDSRSPPSVVPIPCESVAGESGLSFLSRTADANWYARTGWLRLDNALKRWNVGAWPDVVCTQIAALTGLDQDAFDRLFYVRHPEPGRLDDQRRFLGSRVPAVLIETERRKFCPSCLTVDKIHPALFDLTAITVCPRHNVRLQDRCPICIREVRWGGPGVMKCQYCKGELAWAGPMRIPAHEAAGAAAIAQRAGFDLCGAHAPRWPEGTKHFDLGQSIEFLTTLARLATDRRDRPSLLDFAAFDENDRMQVGCETMANWPNGFFNCLDAIANAAKNNPRSGKSRHKHFGFARVYGEFYNRLATAADEPWLFLKSAFARYAAVQTITPITGRRDGAVFTADNVAERAIITPKEGRELGGLKYCFMKKLIDGGAVPTKIGVGGKRNRVFIDRADIAALTEGGVPLGKYAAAAILGVSFEKMGQFADDGVFVPLTGPDIDGGQRYLFARRDLDDLIAAFRKRIDPSPSFRPNTSLYTLLRGQETLRTSSKPVLDAIRDGELPVRGWDDAKTGIAGALFNNREAQHFLHLAHDRERGDIDGLTTLRVSHILSVNPMTAVWLLAQGLLEYGPGTTEKKPKVSRVSLTALQSDCIVVAEIARAHRTNGAIVAKALAAAGNEPLRAVDGEYGILVYRRADVSAVDLNALVLKVGRKAGRTKAEYKRLWKADRKARGLPVR